MIDSWDWFLIGHACVSGETSIPWLGPLMASETEAPNDIIRSISCIWDILVKWEEAEKDHPSLFTVRIKSIPKLDGIEDRNSLSSLFRATNKNKGKTC